VQENENMTKHIHVFFAFIEQLLATSAPIPNDEAILSLMWNMPQSYKKFRSSICRQETLCLQFLIIDLIEEEMLMEILIYQQTLCLPYMLGKKFNIKKNQRFFFSCLKMKGKTNSHQKVVKGFLRLVSKSQRSKFSFKRNQVNISKIIKLKLHKNM